MQCDCGAAWEVVAPYADVGSCARLGLCCRELRDASARGFAQLTVCGKVLDLATRLSARDKLRFDDAALARAVCRADARELVASGLSRASARGLRGALQGFEAVSLARCSGALERNVFWALETTTRLRRLALQSCFRNRGGAFLENLTTLPTLESLDLSHNEDAARKWHGDAALRNVAAACPNLTELDVSHTFSNASSESFSTLMLERCLRLSCLRALGCPLVRWDCVAGLARLQDLAADSAKAHSVHWPSSSSWLHVDLRGVHFSSATSSASASTGVSRYRTRQRRRQQHHESLTTTDEGIATPRLRSLRLREASFASSDVFGGLLRRLVGPTLLALDLSCVRGAGLVGHLSRSLKTTTAPLRSLNLAGFDDDVEPLDARRLSTVLCHLPDLRLLDVSANVHLFPTAALLVVVRDACPRLLSLVATRLGPAEAGSATVDDLRRLPKKRQRRRACAGRCVTEQTGSAFAKRDAFHCTTCCLLGSRVLCAHCARTCHAGHELRYAGHIDMFCDCLFLTPEVHRSLPRLDDDDARRRVVNVEIDGGE